MDKYEAALRTASAIHNLGWNSLSINEESALQNIPEFRERVEEYIEQMRNGEHITKPDGSKSIILDKPLIKYGTLIRAPRTIDFLKNCTARNLYGIVPCSQ
jgi:hypothetical protein